jgi:C1A family cysteine protease
MKLTKVVLCLGVIVGSSLLFTAGQEPKMEKPKLFNAKAKFHKGLKHPKNIKEMIAHSWARHKHHLSKLPKVTAPSWDCRTLGIVPPIVDQGQCGSCWDFSGTGVCTSAMIQGQRVLNLA